ncbi:uncharacterized protein LOC131942643 [Physella acuta]|uniref:uncharacterized protein LOC131942643 n=1 Tax=Physella acuta TaxID=109671 RepID=UPI0027DC7F50|nr:uncharacterized protein LOC131942643 [Physella acuta]
MEPKQPTSHVNRSDVKHDLSLTISPEIERYNGSTTLKHQKTRSEPTEENDLSDDNIGVILIQLTRESMDISNLYAGLQSKWGTTADRDLELAMESLQDRIYNWEKKETDIFEKLKHNGSQGKRNSEFDKLWNGFNQTVGKFKQLKKEIKETRPDLAGLKSSNNSIPRLGQKTSQTTKPDQQTAEDSGLLLHELRADDVAIGETNEQT